MNPRYQILRRAAEGGYATIDQARDGEIPLEVALKRPRADRPGSEAQFAMEARVLAQVRHDHLIILHTRGEDLIGPYLVLEWLAGGTLAQTIDAQPLTPPALMLLLPPLLQALTALHEAGYAHGDVNATNVMRDAGGRLKLIDLGNATRLDDTAERPLASPAIGDIHHMAPELFASQPPGVRTDLYAVGVMTYHALTGRFPFDGDARAQVITAHLRHPCQPLPDSALAPWVHRLLQRDPCARPASALEALRSLPPL